MHKQSAEIDWKQLAEQRKTVNVQREAEIERLHSRLVALERGVRQLAALWESQQAEYPDTDTGRVAAAAVRCCTNELRTLLNPSVSHETEETP